MARQSAAGPPPIIPALAYTGATLAAVIMVATVPRPDSPAAEFFAYVVDNRDRLRLSAVALTFAAIALAVWTAVMCRRVRRLHGDPPGANIALAGGVIAAGAGVLTGLLGWVISRTEDSATAAALQDLQFATGGPGFMAPLCLLFAGIAVPLLLMGIARPLAVTGLVLTATAALSLLTLVTMNAAVLLPITRFGGIIWMIAASLTLTDSVRRPPKDRTPPTAEARS
ncbi:DUF4386 domain-containing protein [Nocardia sp. NPDC057668]|uniref:DUF4386 domain-containing protein n=1 Tax=Nocardia sp. NPDC057668 TaxID=3346202 RepID=UPI00366BF2E2